MHKNAIRIEKIFFVFFLFDFGKLFDHGGIVFFAGAEKALPKTTLTVPDWASSLRLCSRTEPSTSISKERPFSLRYWEREAIFFMQYGTKDCPAKPGLTVMTRTKSTTSRMCVSKAMGRCGVDGDACEFTAVFDFAKNAVMVERCFIMGCDALDIQGRKYSMIVSVSAVIKCTSSGFSLMEATAVISLMPRVIFGTKWPVHDVDMIAGDGRLVEGSDFLFDIRKIDAHERWI